jgi:hypothetical protein
MTLLLRVVVGIVRTVIVDDFGVIIDDLGVVASRSLAIDEIVANVEVRLSKRAGIILGFDFVGAIAGLF